MSIRSDILKKAEESVTGKREQDYGKAEDNFGCIADLWSAYCGKKFNSQDVAMMMVLLKVARIKNGGGSGDSFADIAGYAAYAGEIKAKKDLGKHAGDNREAEPADRVTVSTVNINDTSFF